MALAAALTVAFLLLPVLAIFLRVAPADLLASLDDAVVRDALAVTARTNAVAFAVTVVVGTPAAYLLATRRFRGRGLVLTAIELPLVLPPAVAGVGLLAAFGRLGLLGDAFEVAGVRVGFTQTAVVLAILFVAGPFYVRQAVASFEAVDPDLVLAARTLGAGPARAFRRVALPLASGGLGAGAALSLARGVGEFGATIMFAGSLQGVTQTVTLAIYEELGAADLDVALALGALLVVLSALVLLTLKAVLHWRASGSTSRSRDAASSSQ
ncbi:ABC transporter permease [Miltoncostaea marina]|uniref:ABC transporter permease n=1 Tax=Miltoncostaea marina TaxID=2843215 RepID=UPI001C3CAFA6|nr:ABC transporter permease subunit [Miltoncostaea marina]